MLPCSTMALQQAQLLLHMSSLEPVNFGVHQNNTEAFAVVLCHLAELHAEQVTPPIGSGEKRRLQWPEGFDCVSGSVQRRLGAPAAPEGAVSSSLPERQGEFCPCAGTGCSGVSRFGRKM